MIDYGFWLNQRISGICSELFFKKIMRGLTIYSSLKKAIREAWDKLNDATLNKLVESLPDRLATVMKAKGGNTRY
jgi:hypothetical protein